MKSLHRKKYLIWLLLFLVLTIGSIFAYKYHSKIKYLIEQVYYYLISSPKQETGQNQINILKQAVELTEKNYGKEIDELAKQFNIPTSYLKALILLECAGKKPVTSRFESHVYTQLKKVSVGQIAFYKGVATSDIRESIDQALRNLASSWGPFQLMGYKCIALGITVNDIRDEDTLYWSVKWINLTYGNYLREKKYNQAFHIHNTGKEFPDNGIAITHDPLYVEKGLQYMEYFQE